MWLSVSQNYPCDLRAGTELFAHRFNQSIQNKSTVTSIFYREEKASSGVYEGVPWRSIETDRKGHSRGDHWELRPANLASFRQILRELRPAVVHFHGLSPTLSPDHIRLARELGSKVVMTYHSPAQSCQRWDLLFDDTHLCDGRIEVKRCTDCALRRLGVPRPVSRIFRSVDLHSLSRFTPGPLAHIVERRHGTKMFHSRFVETISLLDVVTYHSHWVREVLTINGVPDSKLLHLPLPPPNSPPAADLAPDLWTHAKPGDFKLLFVGRLIDIKGVHVLIEAITKHLTNEKLSALLIGAPGPADYERRVRSMIKDDSRILLAPPQDESVVLASIRKAGAVVVPSLWPETGPYSVLEALYMGAKVIGANRAGIAERLAGVAGGFLYDPYDAGHLAAAIRQSQRENPTPGALFNPLQYQSEYNSAVSALLAAMLPSGLPSDALADERRQSGTPVVQ